MCVCSCIYLLTVIILSCPRLSKESTASLSDRVPEDIYKIIETCELTVLYCHIYYAQTSMAHPEETLP